MPEVRSWEMKAILIVLLLIGMVLLVLKITDDAVKRMLERLKQTTAEELQQVLEKRQVVEGVIRPMPEHVE